MYLPIFSKRHRRLVERKNPSLNLSKTSKQRILYAMEEMNEPVYDTNAWGYNRESDLLSEVGDALVKEHGWEWLKTYDKQKQELVRATRVEEFLADCAWYHSFDAIELYSKRLSGDKPRFQETINRIFYDAGLPWLLADDTIFRVDSAFMAEVLQCATQLLRSQGFEGAFEEFQKARSHLDSGDTKESIHHANLALESTIKSILGIDREKPGTLIRKMVDSSIIPSYYEGFLTNFEQVLRSVNIARNEERGAGHGQGPAVEEVPHPLSELVLNLCGALTVYLVKQHVEAKNSSSDGEDDIPF